MRRAQLVEVVAAFGDVVGEVVDLGVVGLRVHVLEQQLHALLSAWAEARLQALERGRLAALEVAGEVVAGMDHDPAGAEAAARSM